MHGLSLLDISFRYRVLRLLSFQSSLFDQFDFLYKITYVVGHYDMPEPFVDILRTDIEGFYYFCPNLHFTSSSTVFKSSTVIYSCLVKYFSINFPKFKCLVI